MTMPGAYHRMRPCSFGVNNPEPVFQGRGLLIAFLDSKMGLSRRSRKQT
jgi:hypothetical protein